MANWPISPRLKDYLEVQYELRRVLGEGGMGVVLLATERVLDRPVAIKVLHRHAAEQPELRERFRREARVAARLTHANIVPLHTFGDIDGELFFVMGFVDGETLASRLQREGRIPQDDALRILREVCDALALAHANGVIHRDIKPENVLLEARTGRALLADFGIAREGAQAASLTATGIVIGTPHYMSPEQAVSEGTIDHRADIYSVGVLGYRMLTGRLPFDGANVREILAQQMVATPREFGREQPEISARVAAAVMRSLQKNPADRWPDIASFRNAVAVSDAADDDLPRELADVEGTVPWMVLLSAVGGWLFALNHFWWRKETFGDLLPMLVFAPLLAGPFLLLATGWKHGWERTLSVVCRPPRFWAIWWPRFARRPGDVWDRLPPLIRLGRSIAWTSLAVTAPIWIGTMLLIVTLSPQDLAPFLESTMNRIVVPVAAAIGVTGFMGGAVLMNVWWRSDGKRKIDGRPPWLAEPVASPRWKDPEYARILLAPRATVRAAPESADLLGSAIGEQVRDLVKAGVVQSGAPADVARDVVRAIAGIDRELAMLEKGGDAAELKRLDERIAAASPDGLAPDIVEMLSRQREAVREIVHRQGEQRQRRERLMARLRELFVALDEVRQRANAGGDDVTGRIDVVCSDLRRLASGYDELRA